MIYLIDIIARRRVGQFVRLLSMEVGTDPVTVN